MRKIIPLLFIVLTICACSSIDCPLLNTVYTVYKVYNSANKADTLKDTLTISTTRADGYDSVLINKDVNVTEIDLPISYSADKDILFFNIKDTTSKQYIDTVTVTKENTPHFESVDCSPSFFHKITNITWTKNKIDSIVIKNSIVNYDTTQEHFHIYFKSDN